MYLHAKSWAKREEQRGCGYWQLHKTHNSKAENNPRLKHTEHCFSCDVFSFFFLVYEVGFQTQLATITKLELCQTGELKYT